MSRESSNITDRQSESAIVRPGRPPVALSRMLAAASALFAKSEAPRNITMDAIAAAAGVGKGTLFRAFGSRDGLLDALWAAKLSCLRNAVTEGAPPLGPGAPSADRVVAILDALLTFKLENRQLIRAREAASAGLRQSEHYTWVHNLLQSLVQDAGSERSIVDAGYAAHVLLNAVHLDLIEELLAQGRSPLVIRQSQAELAQAILAAPRD